MAIKLPKLPDRASVKLTISISPELNAALADYAEAYVGAYGTAETVADLVPAMITGFIESDREFQKARSGLKRVLSNPV
jgi:hypothetical protein